VTINCVAPGLIHVDASSAAGSAQAQAHDAAMEKESALLYPMKVWGFFWGGVF
jgi:NAD(P)-dependent dehydrogenase (short-subunit alcohol dehydrogenase family)